MTAHITTDHFTSPYGELLLGVFEDHLVLADWRYRKMRPSIDRRIQAELNATYQRANHPLIDATRAQLTEYFAGSRHAFELPLRLIGTPFQQRVWKALINIPFGVTKTYHQLSTDLGDEKAIRAVATANGANPISIIVPCHRIIGADGKMVGYAGGTAVKKKLLRLEGALATAQLEMF